MPGSSSSCMLVAKACYTDDQIHAAMTETAGCAICQSDATTPAGPQTCSTEASRTQHNERVSPLRAPPLIRSLVTAAPWAHRPLQAVGPPTGCWHDLPLSHQQLQHDAPHINRLHCCSSSLTTHSRSPPCPPQKLPGSFPTAPPALT